MGEAAQAKTRKIHSKEHFIVMLQGVYEKAGVKISREKAWDIYKSTMQGTVDLAIVADVSLGGVGTFTILKSQPRKSKVGKVEFVPRLRFKPSSRIVTYVEQTMGQYIDPVDHVNDRIANAEKMIADGKGKEELKTTTGKVMTWEKELENAKRALQRLNDAAEKRKHASVNRKKAAEKRSAAIRAKKAAAPKGEDKAPSKPIEGAPSKPAPIDFE